MDFSFISNTFLFRGCSEADLENMLQCLDFTTHTYEKGDVIYTAGTVISALGLILSGSVRIENNDFWGNRSVLNVMEPGDTFAEAYACIPNELLMVDVIANEPCEILFINAQKVLRLCSNMCPFHHKLIQNLIVINAKKSLALSQRIFHTSPKTIRGRLMSYFSQQISIQGSNHITIPFDRQQLADYLGVDRSALSKELGKMKQEGLLEFRKNVFQIKPQSL